MQCGEEGHDGCLPLLHCDQDNENSVRVLWPDVSEDNKINIQLTNVIEKVTIQNNNSNVIFQINKGKCLSLQLKFHGINVLPGAPKGIDG